jgi:hypothetical protein
MNYVLSAPEVLTAALREKKQQRVTLHCVMKCARRMKKMPPSGWKTAPMSRVDPALYIPSP